MLSIQIPVQGHILNRRDGRIQPGGAFRRLCSPYTACYTSACGQGGRRTHALGGLRSHDSKREESAPFQLTQTPETGGSACSHSILLATAYSTLMTAGKAAAYVDSPGMSYMQPAWVEMASQSVDTLVLADFSLLPSFNGLPFQILGFLLNHPFITLGLALTVNYVVPRAFRAVIRFLVVPLVLGSIAWVALQNPSTVWGFLQGAFDFVTHHTIETSAVILIGLGFVLSPYLLVGGAVFLLVFGVPNIPAFMRPLVPAPLLEVQRRADEVQRGLQGPLKALGDGLGSTADGIQKTFGVRFLQ